MAKEQVKKMDLTYLEDLPMHDDDGLQVAATFSPIFMGHPNSIQVGGVLADKNKFCCEDFPEQNLESFLFIPLHLNGVRRLMYSKPYSGESVPPDCQSNDGVFPVKPLELNGAVITSCTQCNLHGFSGEFPCRDKPAMVGLAYFPEHGDLIVPVRKDIPATSIKAFNSLIRELMMLAEVNGERVKLPYFSRVVRISMVLQQTKRGLTPTWSFTLLKPDEPNGLVPQHLITDVATSVKETKQLYSAGHTSVKAVPTTQVPAALPASTGEPDITVVAAEEASDY